MKEGSIKPPTAGSLQTQPLTGAHYASVLITVMLA